MEDTMRKKTGLFALAVLCLGMLAMASIASAGISKILCVPWQGNPALPHTALSGQSIGLYAVIYGDSSGGSVTYSWDFKDGSAADTNTINVPANGTYNLAVTHTFTGSPGATFNTVLTIGSKSSIYPIVIGAVTDTSKVNIAIDKGLWFLHTNMTRTTGGSPSVPIGYWTNTGYYVGQTGASVWAFEVQGHLLSIEADPLNPVKDPYVEDVQRGINFLLTRTFYQAMSVQTWGDPDSNGNGYGLVAYWSGGHTNYENGLAMGAIAGSGTPNAKASTAYDSNTQPYVKDRTYKDIIQDMADWYAWSQIDDTGFPPSGGARGGFYYTANANAEYPYYGDNSASQWAYIGLEAAQSIGCTVPEWMKAQLAGYLHGQIAYNNRGYVSYRAGYPGWGDFETVDVTLTGGALVGMSMVGKTAYDAQNGSGSFDADMALIKNLLGNYWQGQDSRWTENWYGHRAYYAMYALMKGFRLNGISSLSGSPGTTDWYKDYVSVMIPDQSADGHWYGSGWMDGYIYDQMGTAFGVLILTPGVVSLSPVACFTAKPNPGYANTPVYFDPSCSYHMDPNKKITLYEWDWESDGVYDQSTVNPDVVTHQWSQLGQYKVTLRVSDNSSNPITATSPVTISLTVPPHPPVSKPGGPYMVSLCASDTLNVAGSASYDIDNGQSESGNPPYDFITAYSWDLYGAPWNYGDELGAQVLLNNNKIKTYFPSANTYNIGLKVTDNTALAYPGSGQGNLSDEGFTTVNVSAGGICTLKANAKSKLVQLTWTLTGASSYDIYRSTAGPNTGFTKIAGGYVNAYGIYVDTTVTNGTTYYYRVVDSIGNGSIAVSAKPMGR
jgi:hypothetical protein